jgi:hypothetical protein
VWRRLKELWRSIISLFDIDKDGDYRGIPKPNGNDAQIQRSSHNTMGTTYRTESDTRNQRIVFKNGVILTYDDENRVSSAYGYIPEASTVPVFIIAKEGYDVYVDILGIDPPVV